MSVTRADLDWWWGFAPTLSWTWATTYATTAPHWYVVEGRTPGLTRADFLRAVDVIFTFGDPGKFYRTANLYLANRRGTLKCWAMPSDPFVTTDDMHVLNLARAEISYGSQTFSGADRARIRTLRPTVSTSDSDGDETTRGRLR